MDLRLIKCRTAGNALRMLLVLSAFLLLGLGFSRDALATNVKIEGATSYSISGSQITVKVARVINNETGGNSGSLRIKLWASTSSFSGSGSCCNGYVLADFALNNGDVLEGGAYYYDIERTLAYTAPPAGTYRAVMVLLEYTASGYVIRDYRNFDNPLTIAGGGGGGGSALSLDGTVSYTPQGNQIRVDVAQVSNSASGGTSGSLMIKLWASTSSYPGTGSCCNGYVLAEFSLNNGNGLAGGFSLSNVSRTLAYTPPPAGTYNVVMVLLENTTAGYVIRDYRNFTNPLTVGGGIGGGSLSIEGSGSYNIFDDTITVSLTGVRNSASSGTSGTLRIKLWASTSSYQGTGTCCSGYVLAEYPLNGGQGVNGGTTLSNLVNTVPITMPPVGTYNVVIVLLEYTGSDYVIRDYRNFNNLMTVQSTSGGGGDDDGGGGGGSTDLALLAIVSLLLLKAMRRGKRRCSEIPNHASDVTYTCQLLSFSWRQAT